MAISTTQRILDLAYSGHPIEEIANLLGVGGNQVRAALQDISQKPSGGVAPASLNQRAVDLAYSGHPVPEIANLTGLSENAIRGLLQDGNQSPSQATSWLQGTTGVAAPAAGGAGALPATPKGYLTVRVNSTAQQIPYY